MAVQHPDLAANVWMNPDEIPGNMTDDVPTNGKIDDLKNEVTQVEGETRAAEAKARADGTAAPRTKTRCAGPASTTRRTVPRSGASRA